MSKEDAHFDKMLDEYQTEERREPRTCEKHIVLIEWPRNTIWLEMYIQAEWTQKEPHVENFEIIIAKSVRTRVSEIKNEKFLAMLWDFANANITEEDF